MNRAQSAADHLPFDERRLRISARSPRGGSRRRNFGSVMQGLIGAANQDHNLARVFSTFTATNPSIFLDIDRDKAQALGVGMEEELALLAETLTTASITGVPE
jgi:multidrug efflux pump subunit AcrB